MTSVNTGEAAPLKRAYTKSAPSVTPPLFRVLPRNDTGRDFFVGDLHGERALLDIALMTVRFDPTVDRVISVGDLLDKGANSPGCLALLDEPWFHYVAGNHERAFVQSIKTLVSTGEFTPAARMGNHWIANAYKRSPASLLKVARRLDQQPCVLVHYGNAPQERFHVVHGSLHDGRSLLTDAGIDAALARREPLSVKAYKAATTRLTWLSRGFDFAEEHGRQDRQPDAALTAMVSDRSNGLSLTFCGHLIMPDVPLMALSHLHIDTGAAMCQTYTDCSLSLVERRRVTTAGFDLHTTQTSPLWGTRTLSSYVGFDTSPKEAPPAPRNRCRAM